jgi:arylsulfatase A-like enzyme
VPASMGWYVFWLPLLMGIVACRPGEEQPPHVIVVSVDTLNRNALRCFRESARPLPVLDAFAEESIRLLNAYSTASWTLPAHASLLTGLYPDRHGANKESRAGGGRGGAREASLPRLCPVRSIFARRLACRR